MFIYIIFSRYSVIVTDKGLFSIVIFLKEKKKIYTRENNKRILNSA